MRAPVTALILTAVAAGAASGQAASGQVASGVRATVEVPPILALVQEPTEAGSAEVRLRVRANVPWRLSVSLPPSEVAGSPAPATVLVEVAGSPGARAVGADGTAVEVARSAGPGDAVVALRVTWAPGSSPAAGASPGVPPRLSYSLDRRD